MTLVLWSGGCDSTMVLWNLLQEQSHATPAIRTISINHYAVGGGPEQAQARATILGRLRAKGFRIDHSDVGVSKDGIAVVGGSIIQPLVWLATATQYLEATEDLYAGWVRGDDAWHYKHDIDWLFIHCQRMLFKTGALRYPLEFTHKSDVIADLRKNKLLDAVWWCEDPIGGKPCDRCGSCVTHKVALARERIMKFKAPKT